MLFLIFYYLLQKYKTFLNLDYFIMLKIVKFLLPIGKKINFAPRKEEKI